MTPTTQAGAGAPAADMTFEQRAALVDIESIVYGPPDPDAGGPAATWPELDPAALHGLAGEIVSTLDPTTEADPVAVLFVLLAWAGCYFGADAYLDGGNTEHPGKVWPILTGESATGAKGTAVAALSQFARKADPTFYSKNRAGGLSSAEGLIKRVRDARGEPDDKDFDEGVTDKRLFVNEPEFANVLTRARREGNSLTMTLRDAYDGVPLETMTSHSPLFASRHHITIVGGVTPGELVARLSAVDITNGFANRFMVVCSKRSKLLPEGGWPDPDRLAQLARDFQDVASKARNVRRMTRTPAARSLWHDEYIARHSRKIPPGPLASLFARWHAHSARLSVIYALLDGSSVVDEPHVRAALAAWDYVEDSARYVFGSESADDDLGRLVEFVDGAELGVTRKQISAELFQRRKTKAELDLLCDKLLGLGRYRLIKGLGEPGRPGRPPMFYVRVGRGAPQETGGN